MHKAWRLWSLRFTLDLGFWPKESRELRGGGWWQHMVQDGPGLMFCAGASGDRVAVATPLLSVTMFILQHSGLLIALCFFPIRLIEICWSAGFCLV